jgi:hypothetical protein
VIDNIGGYSTGRGLVKNIRSFLSPAFLSVIITDITQFALSGLQESPSH